MKNNKNINPIEYQKQKNEEKEKMKGEINRKDLFNLASDEEIIEAKINKRRKNKKRRRIILLLILLFIVAKIGANYYAQKTLESITSDYPFVFSEDNEKRYVTKDFILKNDYFDKTGKEYDVFWESNNEDVVKIENKKAIVSKIDENKKIIISENYEILNGFGKGRINHEVIVVADTELKDTDIKIVYPEKIKNNEYNYNMTLIENEAGSIVKMYGNFNQKIYSEEEALYILNAYKKELGYINNQNFILTKKTTTEEEIVYKFNQEQNGFVINDISIIFTVDLNTFELKNITCSPTKKLNRNVSMQINKNIEEIILQQMEIKKEDIVIHELEKNIKVVNEEYKAVVVYAVINYNGNINYIEVEADSGKIIKNDNVSNIIIEDKIINSIPASGKDELGNEYKFNVIKKEAGYTKDGIPYSEEYYLIDSERDIEIFDSKSMYLLKNSGEIINKLSETPNIYEYIHGKNHNSIIGKYTYLTFLGMDTLIAPFFTVQIEDKDTVFENEIAVAAYVNAINVYDYYKNTFGLYSYDGQGSPLKIWINDNSFNSDTALWRYYGNHMCINETINNKYSYANYPDVIAHEYTHGVLSNFADVANGTEELKTINEAYGDVMAELATDCNWIVATNVETVDGKIYDLRNLKEINNEKALNMLNGYYPHATIYKGENWRNECHADSQILSHIAYQMFENGFSKEEMETIWFKSMTYGYSTEATFIDVKHNIMQAINELNNSSEYNKKYSFSNEDIIIVENLFKQAGILEAGEVYSTEYKEDLTKEEEKLNNFLNNEKNSRFLIIYSPLNAKKGESVVHIYEKKNIKNVKAVDFINAEIPKKINNYYSELNISSDFKIEYEQINSFTFNLIEKFCTDTPEIVRKTLSTDETKTFKEFFDKCRKKLVLAMINETTQKEYFTSVIYENLQFS